MNRFAIGSTLLAAALILAGWWVWHSSEDSSSSNPLPSSIPGEGSSSRSGEDSRLQSAHGVREILTGTWKGTVVYADEGRRDGLALECSTLEGRVGELSTLLEGGGSAVEVEVADGMWSLSGLDPGELLVVEGARSPSGALRVVGPHVLNPENGPGVVELEAQSLRTLDVRDGRTGLPVPGVSAWSRRPGAGEGAGDPASELRLVLEAVGRAGDLQVLEPGTLPLEVPLPSSPRRLLVAAPGFQTVALPADFGGAGAALRIDLLPASTLVASVAPEWSGRDLVLTGFLQTEGVSPGIAAFKQELSSELRIEGLRSGAYLLRLQWEEQGRKFNSDRSLELLAGETAIAEWEPPGGGEPRARVEGVLRLSDSAAPTELDLRLQAIGSHSDDQVIPLRIDRAEGDTLIYSFGFEEAPLGDVSFSVQPLGLRFERVLEEGQNFVSLEAVDVSERTFRFLSSGSGDVVDPELVQLSCEPGVGGGSWSGGVAPINVSMSGGPITAAFPSGRLSYTAWAPGFGWSSGTVELLPKLDFYDIVLDPILELVVTVQGADGQPRLRSRAWFERLDILDGGGVPVEVVSRSYRSVGGLSAGREGRVRNTWEQGGVQQRPDERQAILGVRPSGALTLKPQTLGGELGGEAVHVELPSGWERDGAEVSVKLIVDGP